MKERVKFWRSPQFANLELLHARYVTHSFCRHIHDTYAIGIIQQGAEAFDYCGSTHVAPAGSIALINPGEPHDGHAAGEAGWTYRMLYPDVSILQQAAAEVGRSHGLPCFPEPVVRDDYLTGLILRLHLALEASASQLEQDSRLVWTMAEVVARHAGDR
ncbi:MAG: AraC family ligand binding domain-containing protein, partial [Nodosilinea sp.]